MLSHGTSLRGQWARVMAAFRDATHSTISSRKTKRKHCLRWRCAEKNMDLVLMTASMTTANVTDCPAVDIMSSTTG